MCIFCKMNNLPHLRTDLRTHHQAWFLHDGAPPHFSSDGRTFLNTSLLERWTGRGGQGCPPRSPELNPIHFFIRGHAINPVYQRQEIQTEGERNRIQNSLLCIRTPRESEKVCQSMIPRTTASTQAKMITSSIAIIIMNIIKV
jgi:hypothetical protein